MKFENFGRRGNVVSIRTKMVFIISLLVALSIVSTKAYDYSVRVPELEKAVRDDQMNTVTLTASRLETEIDKTESTLETAANNSIFLSTDTNALVKELQSIKSQNAIFSTVFLADSALNRLNENGEVRSLANREYMQAVKNTKKTVVSREILISQSTNKPSIMIATPIKVPGAPERYLGISINVDRLQGIIAEGAKSKTNYSFAFDGKDGLAFAHPVKEYVGTLKFINPDEKDQSKVPQELRDMASQAVAGHSGTKIYMFNGSKVIAAYAGVPGTAYGVAARMNYEDAMEPIRAERNSAVIIVIIASIFSALIALGLAKYITDPIIEISNQANIIASGDFSKAMNVVIKSDDEIGQLQKAFRNMAVMLKSTMTQIGEAAEHIASSSEVLEASAMQSAQGATQVAETVSEVASGAVDQVGTVDRTVESVKEIGLEIDEIASSASQVARLSKETSAAAVDGGLAIDHAVESITNINDIVQDTANAIRELGNSSNQISLIVDTISGIASQTNLLALNAAIEAARAGEQGLGFSVVADEVRKLAEQSKESAGSIAKIINEVQAHTLYAIEKMNKSAGEVHAGQDIVLAAGESFKVIQNQINTVNHAVQEITVTAQRLSVSSENVITSVEKIREISQETAANSQTISAATEEQSASMQEVAASAESLAQLSAQLEDVLKNYQF